MSIPTAQSSPLEADTGDWTEVSVGDTVVFGTDKQNELSIEFIRDRDGRNFREMGVMPGIGPGTQSDNPLRIIFPNGRDYGGMTETEFNSGMFTVEVEDLSVSEKSARVKILPVYSESSKFDCADYDLGENQYAFCSNTDEDSERGAEQELDLGHTTEIINYVRNDKVKGEKWATTGVNHLFVNPDSGKTLQFWQQKDSTYKGAGIEIIEWRGLSDEHYGNNMQVIVEVDPVSEPDASLSFEKSNHETGEEIILNYEAFEPGRYELRVSGAGQDRTESFGDSTTEDTLSFEAVAEGEINAELIAPGSWWNPLDSDQTVAEASAEVKKPISEINHEFGEKFSIAEDQSTQIEGKSFYLSTLVGNSENGYPSILWRSSEDSNTNSPLVLLRRVNSMGFRYGDDFDPYGVVCSIDPESESAEIVVKQERFNPWEGCDRTPEELRGDNDYNVKDYNLGEKVSLRPGEGLEFGESRVYLEGIIIRDYLEAYGHSEWIGKNAGYWYPPPVGSYTENIFYEGKISTATCSASSSEVEIVMERSSDTGSNWPQAWCDTDNGNEGSDNTDQSSDCEGYDTGSNEFKFCSPKTKNLEVGDQSYEAEFWFVNDKAEEPPTAEINFKGTETFMQLRPQDLDQVNGDAPTKNGYKLYLKEYSGADSQSPEDDSIVVKYVEDSSEDKTDRPSGESDTDDTGEATGSSRFTLGKDEIAFGEELAIEGNVPESTTETYKLVITTPSGDTVKEEEKTETGFRITFTPRENMERGQYKVQIVPTGGLLASIMGSITGSETLSEKTFTVNNPDIPRWEQYCENQDYDTEEVSQEVNCIKENIIPKYFHESTGEQSEIAQSLCQDLLNYNYNAQQRSCEAKN